MLAHKGGLMLLRKKKGVQEERAKESAQPQVLEPAPAPVVRPRKILFVEDDKFYVEVVETFTKLFMLSQLVSRPSTKGVREAIATHKPGLVIVDLDSSRDMLDVIRSIRNRADLKGIPIIAISHSNKRDEALGVQADSFLQKPFKVRELEKTITSLLPR